MFMLQMFQKRLVNARRIIVVGNGGIATELVYVLLQFTHFIYHIIMVSLVWFHFHYMSMELLSLSLSVN